MCTVCWIWVDWKGASFLKVHCETSLGPVTNLLKLALQASVSQNQLKIVYQSHMLHVWNIYQHLPHKSRSFLGKYTIHGGYGNDYPCYMTFLNLAIYIYTYIYIHVYIYIYWYIIWTLYIWDILCFERGCIVVYLMPARFLQSFWTWSRAGIQQGLSFCARALHFTPTGIARWSLGLPPIEPVVVWNCLRNKNALILHSMMSARETRD